MCGIVGLLRRDNPCDPAALDRMRDVVRHRGPDDAGVFIDGPVGLGHRRLSIIDLGGGHQPMSTADGRYTIVFNGEIYNYRELRAELEADGACFRTSSDTEVILHLHALHGATAVRRLNGMFAFAIWDRTAQQLFVARDRAGIKPLYYAHGPWGMAFGSEIKSLFESACVAPRLDSSQLAEYLLFRHVAGPGNLFANVLALPPGHTMTVAGDGRPTVCRYWSPSDRLVRAGLTYAEAVDAVDDALTRSVRRQMIADVPLGTFCSGGIDSSLVTAIASRQAGQQISTFSVGFADSAYDESAYAHQAAEASGSRHHEIQVSEAEFVALLPKLVWHNDLPLNFANSVHIYAVSELARQHVKVVLTGEGADELFGGYPRYMVPRLVELMNRAPRALRAAAARTLAALPDHRLRKVGRFANRTVADAILYNSTTIDPGLVERLLDPALEQAGLAFRETRGAEPGAAENAFARVAQLDFQTYLLSILNRQDKMSMAASLESRVPFLDNEMIDLAASLPHVYKQTLVHRKRVLKAVALRYLPRAIVERRKSGFGVPLREWFRSSGPLALLLRDTIASPSIRDLFTPDVLEDVWREHSHGIADHSDLLWGLLNLSLWRATFRC